MKERRKHPGITACLVLPLLFLVYSCAALATVLPITAALSGGAQLALKGSELYKELKKADERRAFNLTCEQTWSSTLRALEDLSLVIKKTSINEEGDGRVIEAESLKDEIQVAVVKLSENVSEIGIWTKQDKALAEFIMNKIEWESFRHQPFRCRKFR